MIYQRVMIAFSLLAALLLFSIPSNAVNDSVLRKNIASAPKNRSELEKALKYFQQKGDSLELDACRFLISNMETKCFVDYALLDTAKVEVPFDIFQFNDYPDAYKALMDCVKYHPGINFLPKSIVRDLDAITANQLIRNVEYAFRAWRELPWSKELSYEQFREYILPQRSSNEPIDSWRPVLFEKYKGIAANLKDPNDPLEASRYIVNDALKSFVYDTIFHFHPTDQCYSQMARLQRGRCEDIANFKVFVNRANGLAVLNDFVPFWANTSNNHAWNSILDRNGNAVSMEDGRNLYDSFSLSGKAAKVYRTTYSRQDGSLVLQLRNNEQAPQWLDQLNYIDVSKEYLRVADVNLIIPKPIPDSTRFAFLCVFNTGEWKPIDWAKIKKGSAQFRDMGKMVVYSPGFYKNNRVVPFGNAFLLNNDGTVNVFNGNSTFLDSVKIFGTHPVATSMNSATSARERQNAQVLNQVNTLEQGVFYGLYYWDRDWKPIGVQTCMDRTKPMVFNRVPANQLYWFVKIGEQSNRDERIFSLENGNQVWW